MEEKPDADIIYDVLQRRGVTKLYHFTDERNLKSILTHGLGSMRYLKEHGIPQVPGGDGSSLKRAVVLGFDDFVHLSFCKDHPMRYVAQKHGRIKEAVRLEINPVVATWLLTLFSDRNAHKSGCSYGPELPHLMGVRFDIVQQRSQFDMVENEKHFFQAEVMVNGCISPDLIVGAEVV